MDRKLISLPPLICDGEPKVMNQMTMLELQNAVVSALRSVYEVPIYTGCFRFVDQDRPQWWPVELPWSHDYYQVILRKSNTKEERQANLCHLLVLCYKYYSQEETLHLFDVRSGERPFWRLEKQGEIWALYGLETGRKLWEFKKHYQILPLMALAAKQEQQHAQLSKKIVSSTDTPSTRTRAQVLVQIPSPPSIRRRSCSIMEGYSPTLKAPHGRAADRLPWRYEIDPIHEYSCPSCDTKTKDSHSLIEHVSLCKAVTRKQKEQTTHFLNFNIVPKKVFAHINSVLNDQPHVADIKAENVHSVQRLAQLPLTSELGTMLVRGNTSGILDHSVVNQKIVEYDQASKHVDVLPVDDAVTYPMVYRPVRNIKDCIFDYKLTNGDRRAAIMEKKKKRAELQEMRKECKPCYVKLEYLAHEEVKLAGTNEPKVAHNYSNSVSLFDLRTTRKRMPKKCNCSGCIDVPKKKTKSDSSSNSEEDQPGPSTRNIIYRSVEAIQRSKQQRRNSPVTPQKLNENPSKVAQSKPPVTSSNRSPVKREPQHSPKPSSMDDSSPSHTTPPCPVPAKVKGFCPNKKPAHRVVPNILRRKQNSIANKISALELESSSPISGSELEKPYKVAIEVNKDVAEDGWIVQTGAIKKEKMRPGEIPVPGRKYAKHGSAAVQRKKLHKINYPPLQHVSGITVTAHRHSSIPDHSKYSVKQRRHEVTTKTLQPEVSCFPGAQTEKSSERQSKRKPVLYPQQLKMHRAPIKLRTEKPFPGLQNYNIESGHEIKMEKSEEPGEVSSFSSEVNDKSAEHRSKRKQLLYPQYVNVRLPGQQNSNIGPAVETKIEVLEPGELPSPYAVAKYRAIERQIKRKQFFYPDLMNRGSAGIAAGYGGIAVEPSVTVQPQQESLVLKTKHTTKTYGGRKVAQMKGPNSVSSQGTPMVGVYNSESRQTHTLCQSAGVMRHQKPLSLVRPFRVMDPKTAKRTSALELVMSNEAPPRERPTIVLSKCAEAPQAVPQTGCAPDPHFIYASTLFKCHVCNLEVLYRENAWSQIEMHAAVKHSHMSPVFKQQRKKVGGHYYILIVEAFESADKVAQNTEGMDSETCSSPNSNSSEKSSRNPTPLPIAEDEEKFTFEETSNDGKDVL